jgi:hypothetical protein
MRDTIRKSVNRYGRKAIRDTLRVAAENRMAAARLVAQTALTLNECPHCRGPVRQNIALTGWVQCAQFGPEEFRAEPGRPACDWQGFTS